MLRPYRADYPALPYWALMVPRAYVASLSYSGELGHNSAAGLSERDAKT